MKATRNRRPPVIEGHPSEEMENRSPPSNGTLLQSPIECFSAAAYMQLIKEDKFHRLESSGMPCLVYQVAVIVFPLWELYLGLFGGVI